MTFYGENPSFNLSGLDTFLSSEFLYLGELDPNDNLINSIDLQNITFNMSCWTNFSSNSNESQVPDINGTVISVGMNISSKLPSDCVENCTVIQFIITSANSPQTLCFAPKNCVGLQSQALVSRITIFNYHYKNHSNRIDLGSYLYTSVSFMDAGYTDYSNGNTASAVLGSAQILTAEYATLTFDNGTSIYDYVDLKTNAEGYNPIKGTMDVLFPNDNYTIVSVSYSSAMQDSLGATSIFSIIIGVCGGVVFCIIMAIIIIVIYKKCPQLRMSSSSESTSQKENENLIKNKKTSKKFIQNGYQSYENPYNNLYQSTF